MKTDSDSFSIAGRTCLGALISLLILEAFAAGAEPTTKERRAPKDKRARVAADNSAEKPKPARPDPRSGVGCTGSHAAGHPGPHAVVPRPVSAGG